MPNKRKSRDSSLANNTKKDKIIDECMIKLTKIFQNTFDKTVNNTFATLTKARDEEVAASKVKISELNESEDFMISKYDKLKTDNFDL